MRNAQLTSGMLKFMQAKDLHSTTPVTTSPKEEQASDETLNDIVDKLSPKNMNL